MSTGRYGLAGAGIQTAALAWCGRDTPIYNVTEEYDGSSWASGGNYPANSNDTGGCGTQSAGLGVGGLDPNNSNPKPSVMTTTGEYDGSSWTTGGALPATTWQIGVGNSNSSNSCRWI